MKNFTLTELLVVVALIAILLSMLIPSLNSSRQRAKLVVSMSNVKNITNASFGYTSHNSGKLPPARSNTNIKISWDDIISDYIGYHLTQAEKESSNPQYRKAFDILKCPLDHLKRYRDEYTARTYQLNNFESRAQGAYRMFEYLGSKSLSLSQISHPSETIMFNEQSKSGNWVGSEGNVAMFSMNGGQDFIQVINSIQLSGSQTAVKYNPNHHNNNFTNILSFLDGGVKIMNMIETRKNDNWLWKSKKP